jgi:transposase
MLNWSHFEFRQRLRHKANEFGSLVHEVSEHYMSKLCGKCGGIDWKLGRSKTFTCPYCHFSIDRDFTGARNISLVNIENHFKVINPTSSQ